MAEPEDLLIDAARHTTVFVRDLWQRHASRPPDAPVPLSLLAPRLDLLVTAVWGQSLPLRVALPPALPTLLERTFRRQRFPRQRDAVPATDGSSIWLPPHLGTSDAALASALYRAMALQQARRAARLSADAGALQALLENGDALVADVVLLLEARAAEAEALQELPGLAPALALLRRTALDARPPLEQFAPPRRPLEQLARAALQDGGGTLPHCTDLAHSIAHARRVVDGWQLDPRTRRQLGPAPLFRDLWTGEFRPPSAAPQDRQPAGPDQDKDTDDQQPVRSAHMQRRPEQREAEEDEDRGSESSAWMVQQDQPHELAEDPYGLQRPIDRDEETSAEDFGEMVSEMPQARTVSTPGRPREVLLSDDPPPRRLVLEFDRHEAALERLRYPEWDYRDGAYRDPGTTVRVLGCSEGSQAWVDATLDRHRALLPGVRRHFEMLRAQRVRLRRQTDGEDLDLDALVEAHADRRAGGSLEQALYETRRPGQRNLAIMLLVDASGSTDSWISANRRVIDVEREALLLVCIALDGLAEPYAVHTFSGEGPHGVTTRALKHFDEAYGTTVARRIAGLEPERYTRAGAALRHATALLMRQQAAHRLLLLLSDGKPNDADIYDGRYGVEDMRQAVTEARLQGISPFCLTIDRQAATYLPQIFGQTGYALLPTPNRLPTALLDWIRKLLAR